MLSLLKIAEALLSLWVSKEKDKYNSQVLEQKEIWFAEFNKPKAQRNNDKMDRARIKLSMIVDALTNQILLNK